MPQPSADRRPDRPGAELECKGLSGMNLRDVNSCEKMRRARSLTTLDRQNCDDWNALPSWF